MQTLLVPTRMAVPGTPGTVYNRTATGPAGNCPVIHSHPQLFHKGAGRNFEGKQSRSSSALFSTSLRLQPLP